MDFDGTKGSQKERQSRSGTRRDSSTSIEIYLKAWIHGVRNFLKRLIRCLFASTYLHLGAMLGGLHHIPGLTKGERGWKIGRLVWELYTLDVTDLAVCIERCCGNIRAGQRRPNYDLNRCFRFSGRHFEPRKRITEHSRMADMQTVMG